VRVPIYAENSNLLHHAYLLVSLHVLARLPWDSILGNLILESLIKLCCETRNLVTTGQNYQELHMKMHIHFIVAGNINSPHKRYHPTTSITEVTYKLRGHTKILGYKYTGYLFSLLKERV